MSHSIKPFTDSHSLLFISTLILLVDLFNLNAQTKLWSQTFEEGTSAEHIIRINDSIFVVACDNDYGLSPVYLINNEGVRIDSISLDFGAYNYITDVYKIKEDLLLFIGLAGRIISTTIQLKDQKLIANMPMSIYKSYKNSTSIYVLSNYYYNSKSYYIRTKFNIDLKIIESDTTTDRNKFNIAYYFDNDDYLSEEMSNSNLHIERKNSIDQTIWSLDIPKKIGVYKNYIANNNDLIILGSFEHNSIPSQNDLAVIRISSNGNILWDKYFAPLESSQKYYSYKDGNAIIELKDNSLIIGGEDGRANMSQISLLMAMKINSSGDLEWNYFDRFCYDGNRIADIISDSNEDIFLAGSICNTDVQGLQSGVLLKLHNSNTSIDEIKEDKIFVSPNPVNDMLNITMEFEDSNFHLNIYNMEGNLEYQKSVRSCKHIEVLGLASGMHIGEVKLFNGLKYKFRFIKI